MMEAARLSDKSHRVCEGKKESREIPRVELAMSVGLLFTGMEKLQGEQRFWRGGDKSSGGYVRVLSWL